MFSTEKLKILQFCTSSTYQQPILLKISLKKSTKKYFGLKTAFLSICATFGPKYKFVSSKLTILIILNYCFCQLLVKQIAVNQWNSFIQSKKVDVFKPFLCRQNDYSII